jgi:quercetin dioxygenase-like cupin family protein
MENGMRTRTVVGTLLATGVLLTFAARSLAQKSEGVSYLKPEQIVWKDRPGFEGVKFVTLAGDPSKPGVYVIRAKFSPGHMTRPHFHPEDRFVVVVSGTWWMGEGDTFDPPSTTPLKAGSYAKHPANVHHYDGAKDEEVIVQIVGYGPSGTTLVHPEQGETGNSLKK